MLWKDACPRGTMMFKRIDHVEIVMDQLDCTVQFYTSGSRPASFLP
jgi:hypothetical protein